MAATTDSPFLFPWGLLTYLMLQEIQMALQFLTIFSQTQECLHLLLNQVSNFLKYVTEIKRHFYFYVQNCLFKVSDKFKKQWNKIVI